MGQAIQGTREASIPSILVTCLLCAVVIVFHLLFSTWQHNDHGIVVQQHQHQQHQQHNPVLQMIQEAAVTVSNSTLYRNRPQLKLQPQCQAGNKLQGVLRTAAAFKATAAYREDPGPISKPQQAQQLALQLRQKLAKEWAAVLEPFKPQGSSISRSMNDRGTECKSVGLVPLRPGSGSNRTTALLLVMDSWERLDHLLALYSINLLTMWLYARMHNYGIEIYIHGQPLPAGVPVFFIKPAGIRYLFRNLGYQHVLYLDWDTFTSPHSAPPLSLFFGEFPQASLLLQAEHNLCAAAGLWRNTPEAEQLLQAWWDLGHAGCCPTFPHDQTALKHMTVAYVANVTGQPWLYGPRFQRRFKLPATPPASGTPAEQAAPETQVKLSIDYLPVEVGTWLRLRPLMLQHGSAIGFVGLDAHYPTSPGRQYSRVVLHNCLGLWWGCVPEDTPSLLYHTGHWSMEKLDSTWLPERLLSSLKDWLSMASLSANTSIMH